MIYYTAVPASGVSCSRAATAGQPAHTHTYTQSSAHRIPSLIALVPAALDSPGTQELVGNLPVGGEQTHRQGGTRAQCEEGREG